MHTRTNWVKIYENLWQRCRRVLKIVCFFLQGKYWITHQGIHLLLISSTAHSMFWFDMTLEMYFDILIVRHELPDAARHVTRRRARPPMPPFRKLRHCTDMLHSNLLPMTTLFSISMNDYNKTEYLVYCFYESNKSPTSFISFSSWVATLALSITMSI